MPLGTEVNLGPDDIVLDGVAAPPKRGTAQVFGSCLLWPNGWMDEDAIGTEVGLGPGHIVLHWVQLSAKGAQQPPPCFRPMSIVATVAHLNYR